MYDEISVSVITKKCNLFLKKVNIKCKDEETPETIFFIKFKKAIHLLSAQFVKDIFSSILHT